MEESMIRLQLWLSVECVSLLATCHFMETLLPIYYVGTCIKWRLKRSNAIVREEERREEGEASCSSAYRNFFKYWPLTPLGIRISRPKQRQMFGERVTHAEE